MAFFRKNYRTFTFPDNCPSTSIDIHKPSKSFSGREYHPPFPPPPSADFDGPGLKARISWGNMVANKRNIMPRTRDFINWWKETWSLMLRSTPIVRKNMRKEMAALDGEVHSKWEKVHGPNGLCFALVEVFNAMAELRMKAEYGDYLAYALNPLKGQHMDKMIWKLEKLDWQEVAKRVLEEEKERKEKKEMGLAPPATPFLDDIQSAALLLDCDCDLVRYQIIAYAERNEFVHNGIKNMMNQGHFYELAERILEDLRALSVIFRDRPSEQIDMRATIKMVEREWFNGVWMDRTQKGHPIQYIPTDKTIKKLLTLKPPGT